jgi:hypothetical protein
LLADIKERSDRILPANRQFSTAVTIAVRLAQGPELAEGLRCGRMVRRSRFDRLTMAAHHGPIAILSPSKDTKSGTLKLV